MSLLSHFSFSIAVKSGNKEDWRLTTLLLLHNLCYFCNLDNLCLSICQFQNISFAVSRHNRLTCIYNFFVLLWLGTLCSNLSWPYPFKIINFDFDLTTHALKGACLETWAAGRPIYIIPSVIRQCNSIICIILSYFFNYFWLHGRSVIPVSMVFHSSSCPLPDETMR